MRKLAIIGASGHGKVVVDIAKKSGYTEIVFLDDNEKIIECGGYPVVGKSSDAVSVDFNIIVGIGDPEVRKRILESIPVENLATLIHPDAVIAENVVIGVGTIVMAGAVINTGTVVGRGCIVNACSSVDHDCVVCDYVHISVGAHIVENCEIGEEAWIGAGVTVSNNVNICGKCIIGAGAVMIKDIEETGTYFGVPAKEKEMSKHKLIGGNCTSRKSNRIPSSEICRNGHHRRAA